MIPNPEYIQRLVEDYQFNSNLIAIPMLAFRIMLRPTVTVKRSNTRPLMKGIYNRGEVDRIKQRISTLEKRQTLTESELTLLKGQLDRVNLPTR